MHEPTDGNDVHAELHALRLRLSTTEVALSREAELAGMALVSNGILHNVGNVLNGVVIAADVVKEMTQDLRIDGVGSAAKLLDELLGGLGPEGIADARAQKLLVYLTRLSERLEAQRERVLEELTTLVLAVDHLKDITKMQQSYAKDDQVSDRVVVRSIVDDALKLSRTSLERHHIQVTQDYRPVPDIRVAKHAVLQILINLLQNAKQAMGHLKEADKQLVIRLRDAGDASVLIEIADNGVGITEDGLGQLFAAGYTTRPDGHGFGLHISRITAEKLGGSLSAASEGQGCGATFSLVLPVRPPPPATNEPLTEASAG